MKRFIFIALSFLIPLILTGQNIVKELTIEKQYLNFPVDMQQERQLVRFIPDKDSATYSVIRISDGKADYWVFKDVSGWMGQKLKLIFSRQANGIEMIYQSDKVAGQDSLYKEKNRPLFHFSSRRGWNNDPNGLVYCEGEYHLFYQHNPYETQWENMHWGHAVSKDLIHWTELNDALYPDHLGTMFSGSAVIDKNNTSGFGKNALIAIYTADNKGKEAQCLAFSTDKGRTFTKYAGNPVAGETRDPKVIWFQPNQEWVMVLYKTGGISFLTSKDLKAWKEQSHINGFFECPELFELPVDGKPDKTLWVVYGGSGTYMLGDFDGRIFTPHYGKYRNTYGANYAAQTYNNTPDGRRIQIAWGRIEQPGMPFNQMMLFPTVLTLRTTNEGIRMFSEPIDAINELHEKEYDLSGLDIKEVNEKLSQIGSDLLHITGRFESLNGSKISISYRGNNYISMDADEINGIQTPLQNPGSLVFDIEVFIDRTSIESFFQNGLIEFADPLKKAAKQTGLEIVGDPSGLKIHNLKVYELRSIWE
ncbi:MAG: glycoside hydrolase family 32 protein [Bacteroidota bacterium]|nr:glycoside hydrolase family 32 protein [Bacteroidota bacterium]